jgi:large subunit ribosomal protein L31
LAGGGINGAGWGQIGSNLLAARAACGYSAGFVETEEGVVSMKQGIHPEYGEATITCACGNVIKTRSTRKDMQVNTCSSCHPFYTGQSTYIDSEGRVEQFKRRYGRK